QRTDAEEVLGRSFGDLFEDEATRLFLRQMNQVLRSGLQQRLMLSPLMGVHELVFEAVASPYLDGVSVIARNITKRVQAEEALRKRSRCCASRNE
ncbi:MAG: PAS domain-containing protein, partial [Verrucomicrobiae bacterium]|nr:PAS domain-containing protein [Verrucomicrobiae bacterium]